MFNRYANQVWCFSLLFPSVFKCFSSSLHCLSICPFSDIDRSQLLLLFLCLLSERWAERQAAPEAPEWQLPSWWVDLYHVCAFKMFKLLIHCLWIVTQNLLGIWVFLCLPFTGTTFGFGVDTCRSMISIMDVSYKKKQKKQKTFYLISIFFLQITLHYHARKYKHSDWEFNSF